MKKIFSLLLIFIFVFSFSVLAAEKESFVSVNNDDNALVVYTVDNISSDDGFVFGLPESDFREYMQANNIVVYGVDADNTFVFNLACTETSFSNEISDFYDLNDDDVLVFADDFVNNKDGVVNVNGIKYVVSNSKKENDGVTFSVRQYITVRNSNLYVLTFNVPTENLNDEISSKIDDTINRISIIRDQNDEDDGGKFAVVLLILLIAIIAVVSVTVIISLIKDIKKKKE